MCFDMRKFLLLLLSFISLSVFSQDLVINPDPVSLSTTTDIADKKVDFEITNNSGSEMEFYWTIDRGNVPEEWQFSFCDLNLCYLAGVVKCPCSKPNLLLPNETKTLMMHILPNGTAGTGAISLSIITVCDDETSNVIDLPITFEVGTTSTEFASINNNINLYPNPAIDMINLQEDEDVSQIELYNIVGKKIRTFQHSKGQSHDVSDFNKGIYLVRLLDRSNNILKVIRMTKK